jgi:hypothetical protein
MLYRAGRFQEAVRRLKEADLESAAYDALADTSPQQQAARVYAWLFLAMAHDRLGGAEEARQWLDRSARWIDQAIEQSPNSPNLGSLRLRQELRLLRREAESLIRPSGR